ncbi:phthalate transporter [Brevundimonas sp. 2R-24]|uniref:Phthalate transporter n=1 Tax=Peiella sedimenti TaxID=3061083 RepID=A0ABT8SPH6_9CAUL|nr:phthalate transporter [Caulobacteraceae bacterium XZ-24]
MSGRRGIPGLKPLIWREPRGPWTLAAWLLAVAWPPLVITLLLFPPQELGVALGSDWRLTAMVVGLIGVPFGIALIDRERRRGVAPLTRLGIVWRFVLFGAVGSVIGELILTLVMIVNRFIGIGDLLRAASGAETAVLLYGVGFLPFAMLVGASYAAWAGLAVSLLAFTPKPERVRSRLGLLDDE